MFANSVSRPVFGAMWRCRMEPIGGTRSHETTVYRRHAWSCCRPGSERLWDGRPSTPGVVGGDHEFSESHPVAASTAERSPVSVDESTDHYDTIRDHRGCGVLHGPQQRGSFRLQAGKVSPRWEKRLPVARLRTRFRRCRPRSSAPTSKLSTPISTGVIIDTSHSELVGNRSRTSARSSTSTICASVLNRADTEAIRSERR